MGVKYDIFISYRRSGFESANLIATRLKAEGYSVFIDVESLRSGKFNEQLYDVIDNCIDFLVILPEGALDRCVDPEDWVRKEVGRALEKKKNIIPVMLYNFSWPDPMPSNMESLKDFQAVTASSVEYFDMSIRRLSERYLKSKRFHVKTIRKILLSIVSIVIILFSVFIVCRIASLQMCNTLANELIDHVVRLDLLGENIDKTNSEWNSFLDKYQRNTSIQYRGMLISDMMTVLDNSVSMIKETIPTDTMERDFSFLQSLALLSRGILSVELKQEPSFAVSYFDDYQDNINIMMGMLDSGEITSINKNFVASRIDLSNHMLAMGYYSYMELLSKMPKKSKTIYEQLTSSMKSLPNDVNLYMRSSYYITKQNNEYNKCERIIQELQAYNKNLGIIVDELDEKMNTVNDFYETVLDSQHSEEERQQEITIRTEKLEAKKILVDSKKAELEKLDKEYIRVYEELKKSCSLEENDEKWYKWGKIIKFATFMDMIVNSRKQLEEKGIRSTSSITPDVAYATLASLLNTFKEYHPESTDLVETAKVFYKDVSKGKRKLEGVVICDIKEGAEHPIHKIGDIIISMKGVDVTGYSVLKEAFKKEGASKESFLRLENGSLVEHTVDDCGPTDVLGYNVLKNE